MLLSPPPRDQWRRRLRVPAAKRDVSSTPSPPSFSLFFLFRSTTRQTLVSGDRDRCAHKNKSFFHQSLVNVIPFHYLTTFFSTLFFTRAPDTYSNTYFIRLRLLVQGIIFFENDYVTIYWRTITFSNQQTIRIRNNHYP